MKVIEKITYSETTKTVIARAYEGVRGPSRRMEEAQGRQRRGIQIAQPMSSLGQWRWVSVGRRVRPGAIKEMREGAALGSCLSTNIKAAAATP